MTKILIIRCGSHALELIENVIKGHPDVYHVVCAVPEYTDDRSGSKNSGAMATPVWPSSLSPIKRGDDGKA